VIARPATGGEVFAYVCGKSGAEYACKTSRELAAWFSGFAARCRG
jgi:hypothetical protein